MHQTTPTPTPKVNDIHECLEHIMQQKGLTAYALSKELGFDKPAKLYTILRRKTKPSYETLVSILTRFEDLNGDWLLRGKGEPFKTTQTHIVSQNPDGSKVSITTSEQSGPSTEALVLRERAHMLEKQLGDREDTIQLLKQQIMILREVIHRESGPSRFSL
ncbi:hypothetical protein GCM10027275_22760 [Rhabdobacter roseus]|uniref:XRE family transcriptional regulator n=1 Tax=Rhabdobacter roseus TaxID=1655419 RepID=A0A840TSG8_9BACT|nr:helix-turn-helix transcriptional regulator [Rhabdobacter roseus]MBB5284213.1 hypothetical protein [Rhabdobacter roseus]